MESGPTPAELGYRFPAEWEPHRATWLAWPHNRDTWPGRFDAIPPLWAELVRAIVRFEPVEILAGGAKVMDQAARMVGNLPGVRLHEVPTNDAWIRDHGPTFLCGPPGQARALIDWQYNAWGGKYPPYDLDNEVPRRIAELTGYRRFATSVVLEGGAIDSNGQGTILAAERCLLSPTRNPGLSRSELERHLRQMLGCAHVIWLDATIVGDDTDGHVDQYARFVRPRVVVAAVEADPRDANYEPLQANLRRLETAADQHGRPLEVVPLPMPRPVYCQGQRVPASYANFYLANGLVIVPRFGDPADAEAAETLAKLFPDRQLVGLPALDLALGLGGFHCITQQEPACPEGGATTDG